MMNQVGANGSGRSPLLLSQSHASYHRKSLQNHSTEAIPKSKIQSSKSKMADIPWLSILIAFAGSFVLTAIVFLVLVWRDRTRS